MTRPKSMRPFRVFGIIALAIAVPSAVAAQTFTGGVRGVVSDANGIIPGVTVTSSEFTVTSAGNVSFACTQTTCGEGHFDMTGTLVVEPYR